MPVWGDAFERSQDAGPQAVKERIDALVEYLALRRNQATMSRSGRMFADVCDTLAGALRRLLSATTSSGNSRRTRRSKPLSRLREAMRTRRLGFGGATLTLALAVRDYDRLTRDEGFHALHDWDGVAAHVNPDTIPVDVLDYIDRSTRWRSVRSGRRPRSSSTITSCTCCRCCPFACGTKATPTRTSIGSRPAPVDCRARRAAASGSATMPRRCC